MALQDAEKLILVDVRDGVGLITLNRPDKLNAMTGAMLEALRVRIANMRDDPDVACVVLTGAGRGFCSGGDLSDPGDRKPHSPEPTMSERAERLARFTEAATMLHDMPKPTIALVNGPCAGAGFSLAGACDLRFMAESAFLTSAFLYAGVSGDFGGSYFWSRIAGAARTRELYLLSERVGAEKALAQGLVNRVYPDDELVGEGLATAHALAAAPRHVLAQMKRNISAAEQGNMATALDCELQGMVMTIYQSLASRA